jgi:hypothetical protein
MLHDNVNVFRLKRTWEDLGQSSCRMSQRLFFDGGEVVELLLESVVGGDRDLPQNERVGVDTRKRIPLLLLYHVLEGADISVVPDLDSKDMAGIFAEHKTVELECAVDGCRGIGGQGI